MLRSFILTVHILLALMIVFLVLMQRGKGAEAGAGFGAGASGTVFGARGTGRGACTQCDAAGPDATDADAGRAAADCAGDCARAAAAGQQVVLVFELSIADVAELVDALV